MSKFHIKIFTLNYLRSKRDSNHFKVGEPIVVTVVDVSVFAGY